MKDVFRACLALLFAGILSPLLAQEGHKIDIDVEGFTSSEAYLAYYYGDKQYIKDTAAVTDGAFVFAGEEPLDGGIYLVVLPPENNFFELVIDKDQQFSIKTDITDLVMNVSIAGSEENELFYHDIRFLGERRTQVQEINEKIKALGEVPAAQELKDQITVINQEVQDHRGELTKNTDFIYAKMLKAIEEPKIPETPILDNGRPDSTFPFRYYKTHYFDNLDFSDDRMLRTPIMHNRVDQYLERLTVKNPDSLIVSVDYICEKAAANDDIFQYFVVTLLNKYAGSKIMGMDQIYVHMVEQYYMKDRAFWADPEQIAKMEERALAISPTIIGKAAPGFSMQDISGNWQSLYAAPGEYTILYFWDYDCGHCKKVTPKLGEAYQNWKDQDVSMVAVSINGSLEDWKKKVEEYGLSDGINLQDHRRQSGFDKMYDIRSTPRLLLLDKDKKIVAKHISVEQMENLLDHFINGTELKAPTTDKSDEEAEGEE